MSFSCYCSEQSACIDLLSTFAQPLNIGNYDIFLMNIQDIQWCSFCFLALFGSCLFYSCIFNIHFFYYPMKNKSNETGTVLVFLGFIQIGHPLTYVTCLSPLWSSTKKIMFLAFVLVFH